MIAILIGIAVVIALRALVRIANNTEHVNSRGYRVRRDHYDSMRRSWEERELAEAVAKLPPAPPPPAWNAEWQHDDEYGRPCASPVPQYCAMGPPTFPRNHFLRHPTTGDFIEIAVWNLPAGQVYVVDSWICPRCGRFIATNLAAHAHKRGIPWKRGRA